MLMNFNTITTIARQELTINIRNHWTLLFAVRACRCNFIKSARPSTKRSRLNSVVSASIALLQIAYRDSFQPDISHHDLGFRIVVRPLP